MRHKSVGGSAPDEDWPPSVFREKRFPISARSAPSQAGGQSHLHLALALPAARWAPSRRGWRRAMATCWYSCARLVFSIRTASRRPPFMNNASPMWPPVPTSWWSGPGGSRQPGLGRNRISAHVGWDETTGTSIVLRERGGGVRVAKITRASGFGNPDQVTRYLYTMQDGSREISSGSLLAWGLVYELWTTYVHAEGFVNVEEPKFSAFRKPLGPGTTQGSHVGYKQVTVLQGASGENGKTVYRYTSPIDFPDFQSFTVPFPRRPVLTTSGPAAGAV